MAVAKLSEAERAKSEMENELKRKEQELRKRTGARFQARTQADGAHDVTQMAVSHRGPGAFSRVEMMWRRKADGAATPPSSEQVRATATHDAASDASIQHDSLEQARAMPDTAAAQLSAQTDSLATANHEETCCTAPLTVNDTASSSPEATVHAPPDVSGEVRSP